MRIISIVGLKDAGKTTLIVALAREFLRQGKRVATIKHASHPADLDHQGTDSWRHFHEGLADGVLLATPNVRAVIERRRDDADPETLARQFFSDRDIVLVEGFKQSDLPKVEVYRKEAGPTPLISSSKKPELWIAVCSDTAIDGAKCPVLRFTDTMWLQLLVSYVWNQAKVLGD